MKHGTFEQQASIGGLYRVHNSILLYLGAVAYNEKSTVKYIRGGVYNSIFYYLPADVYKLYNRRILYMLGGEYIGGGEYSSRQRCVHW